MRYKVVGILSLIFGVSILVFVLGLVIFVLPKLNSLYSTTNVSYNPLFQIVTIVLNLALGIWNMYLGIKLFSNNLNIRDKYFGKALLSLLVTFFLGGVLIAFTTLSVIMPIYQLTSQLQ